MDVFDRQVPLISYLNGSPCPVPFLDFCGPEREACSKSTGTTGTTEENIKTSFNYGLSGNGQNSVIPVVCNVPE